MDFRKSMLYKMLILTLVALMVFALTGCGGKESSSDNGSTSASKSEGVSSSTVGSGSNATDDSDDDYDDEDFDSMDFGGTDYDEMLDSGAPPVAVGITRYLDVKGTAYEMLTPAMDTVSQTNPMAALAYLPLVTVDLTILPLTMLAGIPPKGDNLWEGTIMFMYNGTGRVEVKGDISTFSMEINNDDTGEIMNIEGKYDIATDSFQANFTMEDGEEMFFEFTASDDGYVSQIYSEGVDGSTVIKNAVNNTKLYAGLIESGSRPASIYQKKVTDWEGFVKNDTLMVVLDNGKGYTILDGEKYEH